MIQRQKHLFIKLIYIVIDICFIAGAIFLATLLRKDTLPFPISIHFLFFSEVNPFRDAFLVWFFVSILFNNSQGLYTTKREMSESFEIWRILKSVFLSCLAMVMFIYLARVQDFPRSIFIFVTILLAVFFSIWRICKRLFVQYLVAHGYNNFNVLIVGAGKVGMALANEIKNNSALGLSVVGFLDDFKKDEPVQGQAPILGSLSDFIRVSRREFIDEVFITTHNDNKIFIQLLEQAKVLNVAVRVIPQGFDLTAGEFNKFNIGFIPVLEYSNAQTLRKQFGKRLFDFFASLAFSVLLLPVFIALGILIKVDSPGPVFYKSKRYGRGGRIFKMYKFRTMAENADEVLKDIRDRNEVDGPIFKIKKDPRVTKLGRFLRKHSLDELPQILNVLKGEMSLVGPRPFPIEQIEKEDLRQLKRLEVRPGITGLWQIRGRSDVSFAKLIRWDIWYINNWSFWLDMNIIFQTFPVVIKGQGAY